MDSMEVFARFCMFLAIGAAALIIDSGSLCSVLVLLPGLVYAAILAVKLQE